MLRKYFLAGTLILAQAILAQIETADVPASKEREIYIIFRVQNLHAELPAGSDLIHEYPELSSLKSEFQFELVPAYNISEDSYKKLRKNALTFSGSAASIDKLQRTFKVVSNGRQNPSLLSRLKRFPFLEAAETMPSRPVPPPGDILPITPNFEPLQDYLNPNPGVNMKYAWDLGVSGSGVRVSDIEYGFDKEHEEFNDFDHVSIAPGTTISTLVPIDWYDHGTAVMGIIGANKGDYGVSGMAYGIDGLRFFPQLQQGGGGLLDAISGAMEWSQPGDVIVYELQTYGQNDEFVPAEFDLPIWNLTKAATDAGIIVVAAAGNGNQDLDGAYYASYMSRGDSGAIIVGAGSSTSNHDKLLNSTFGSRVDLQGWGENVYTTGYGGMALIGGDYKQSYCLFNGTSSATPMVASCAAVLQSYYKALTGNTLLPENLREILVATGIPQGSGGHIGPLPDMQAAINAVNQLKVVLEEDLKVVLTPNPVESAFSVLGARPSPMTMEIVNPLGQVIRKFNVMPQSSVDVSDLSNGFYLLRIVQDGRSTVCRFLKK